MEGTRAAGIIIAWGFVAKRSPVEKDSRCAVDSDTHDQLGMSN